MYFLNFYDKSNFLEHSISTRSSRQGHDSLSLQAEAADNSLLVLPSGLLFLQAGVAQWPHGGALQGDTPPWPNTDLFQKLAFALGRRPCCRTSEAPPVWQVPCPRSLCVGSLCVFLLPFPSTTHGHPPHTLWLPTPFSRLLPGGPRLTPR